MFSLRRPLVGLALALLPLSLITFGILISLLHVFSTPAALEQALDKSGIYSAFVQDSLTQSQGQSTSVDTAATTIPANDPAITAIIKQSFPPAYLKTQTTGVINAFYEWLQGKTAELNFIVDLRQPKQTLADNLAAYTDQRLASLPPCATVDLTAISDPLKATCVPAGLDRAAAVDKVHSEVLDNSGFIDTTVITPTSLKTPGGQPLDYQLRMLPTLYKWAHIAAWVSGILALACLAVGVFLASRLAAGLKRVGITMITCGLLSVLLAWGSSFVTSKLVDILTKDNTGRQPLQVDIAKILDLLAHDVRAWWLVYGIVVAILGIAAVVAGRFLRGEAVGRPLGTGADHMSSASPSPSLRYSGQPGQGETPLKLDTPPAINDITAPRTARQPSELDDNPKEKGPLA